MMEECLLIGNLWNAYRSVAMIWMSNTSFSSSFASLAGSRAQPAQ